MRLASGPDIVFVDLDIQFGLGFMVRTDLVAIGGERSFGHFGYGGSFGWADPDAELAMGYTMNPPSEGWTTNPEPLAGGGSASWTTTRDLQTMVRDYLEAMGGRKEKLLVGVSVDVGGTEWRCRSDQPLSPTLGPGSPARTGCSGGRRSLRPTARSARGSSPPIPRAPARRSCGR